MKLSTATVSSVYKDKTVSSVPRLLRKLDVQSLLHVSLTYVARLVCAKTEGNLRVFRISRLLHMFDVHNFVVFLVIVYRASRVSTQIRRPKCVSRVSVAMYASHT